MFLNVDNVGVERMCSGRLFRATGPATQNARLDAAERFATCKLAATDFDDVKLRRRWVSTYDDDEVRPMKNSTPPSIQTCTDSICATNQNGASKPPPLTQLPPFSTSTLPSPIITKTEHNR